MSDPDPAALERALFEHPGVADCAVGAPHDGVVPVEVVLRPGAKVTAEELGRQVAHRLGPATPVTRFVLRAAPRRPDGAPPGDGAAVSPG